MAIRRNLVRNGRKGQGLGSAIRKGFTYVANKFRGLKRRLASPLKASTLDKILNTKKFKKEVAKQLGTEMTSIHRTMSDDDDKPNTSIKKSMSKPTKFYHRENHFDLPIDAEKPMMKSIDTTHKEKPKVKFVEKPVETPKQQPFTEKSFAEKLSTKKTKDLPPLITEHSREKRPLRAKRPRRFYPNRFNAYFPTESSDSGEGRKLALSDSDNEELSIQHNKPHLAKEIKEKNIKNHSAYLRDKLRAKNQVV